MPKKLTLFEPCAGASHHGLAASLAEGMEVWIPASENKQVKRL